MKHVIRISIFTVVRVLLLTDSKAMSAVVFNSCNSHEKFITINKMESSMILNV